MSATLAPAEPARESFEGAPPHHSAMSRRFGWLASLFARLAFRHVRVDPESIGRLRRLAGDGTLVYVMRYCSLVDYFLVNYVLLRADLPLPRFANGVSAVWFRPLRDVVGALWAAFRTAHLFGREVRRFRERGLVAHLVTHGRSVLLFIRSSRRSAVARARSAPAPRDPRQGSDYLREIVHELWGKEGRVYLVPMAIFRGSGLRRKGSRLASFVYSVHEAPSDVKRLVTYLWNARELTISVGVEIPLNDFMRNYQREGEDRIVRRLTRMLQIFLYREERVVWGPTLRSKRQVREMVLGADAVVEAVRKTAEERKVPIEKVAREARGIFDEMAANFHGHYFAIVAFFFHRMWYRMFSGLDVRGLDKVVETLKDHPIVLVPCHRSHFDYLILSHIFHENFLSPPHIAAGINMAFWPMGPFFRGAGAYFIRRTFEGEVYKAVFRKYLEFLIREGYTQEFFIEGGRSRTGKILTPKLGMLSAIVNAFIDGVRRDLFLVPVSIHYGRIVEEEAYKDEILGGQKEKESFAALIKARRVLRQKYGTVYVTFAEPISLAAALGDRKERFRSGEGEPAIEEEKRYFVQKLGFRLLREVNDVAVAGATSLSSTVLLSAPQQAIRYADFVIAARALTELLVARGVTLTASLHRNVDNFLESLNFLQTGKLVEWMKDRDGDIIYVPPEKRMILDFYKNNIIHFFLIPSLVAHALRRGVSRAALREEVAWWLDVFRWEFALPEREAVLEEVDWTIAYLTATGAIDGASVRRGHVLLTFADGILESFREAYWIAAKTLLDLDADGILHKAAIARMQKSFIMHQLLGQAVKPEGNSAVTFANAIARMAEMRCVLQVQRGRGGKDRVILPGPEAAALLRMERRLAESLGREGPGRPGPALMPPDGPPIALSVG